MATINAVQWTAATPESTNVLAYGEEWYHHTARREWSVKTTDNNDIRFEMRQGDRYTGFYPDGTTTERCELGLARRIPVNQLIANRYKFMIEPGAKFTMRWMSMGQWHSAISGYSPLLETVFRDNDRMTILGRYGTNQEVTLFTDTTDVVRGKWYDMQIFITPRTTGAPGSAVIYRDGVRIVNYTGPFGFPTMPNTYWKNGIYRGTAPETVVAHFSDLKFFVGAEAQTAFNAAAVNSVPTPPPAPVIDYPARLEAVILKQRAAMAALETEYRNIFKA